VPVIGDLMFYLVCWLVWNFADVHSKDVVHFRLLCVHNHRSGTADASLIT
jgi:hypothetical protein